MYFDEGVGEVGVARDHFVANASVEGGDPCVLVDKLDYCGLSGRRPPGNCDREVPDAQPVSAKGAVVGRVAVVVGSHGRRQVVMGVVWVFGEAGFTAL